MDDLISRQAAIDACIRVREHRAYDEIEEIKALPSVDEYSVVAEYCRKRRLVIMAADLFEKIKKEYVGEEYWIR